MGNCDNYTNDEINILYFVLFQTNKKEICIEENSAINKLVEKPEDVKKAIDSLCEKGFMYKAEIKRKGRKVSLVVKITPKGEIFAKKCKKREKRHGLGE